MRTLLRGVLAATLVGCSYPLAPQASMEARTQTGSAVLTRWRPVGRLNRRQRRPGPVPRQQKSSPPSAARAQERSTAAVRDRPQPAEKKPASTVIEAKVEAPASGRPAETSDAVIVKAKTTIAAKLEDPASAEFGEMKRAIRKNTLGKAVDTICGRVKRKKASGEDAGDWPFLYLVREDEAYVVNGPANSAAASAYRNICSEPGTTEPPPGSIATDRKVP